MDVNGKLFKKFLEREKKNLENQINVLNNFLRSTNDDRMMIESYKRIGMFLNVFPPGFKSFRENYLFPHLNRYQHYKRNSYLHT